MRWCVCLCMGGMPLFKYKIKLKQKPKEENAFVRNVLRVKAIVFSQIVIRINSFCNLPTFTFTTKSCSTAQHSWTRYNLYSMYFMSWVRACCYELCTKAKHKQHKKETKIRQNNFLIKNVANRREKTSMYCWWNSVCMQGKNQSKLEDRIRSDCFCCRHLHTWVGSLD